MKRKLIEKIPWQAVGSKTKIIAVAGIHQIAGEDVLIVDLSVDKPLMRIALSHSDFENWFPEDSPCKRAPRWGRMPFNRVRRENNYFFPYGQYQKAKLLAEEDTAHTIHEFVYGKEDVYHTSWEEDISHLQYIINNERRDAAEDRRCERVIAKMETVPEPTEAFQKWAKNFVDVHMMMILPFRKKSVAKAVCSACGKEHEYKRGMVKAGSETICPNCGVTCMVRRVDYENQNPLPVYRFKKEVILFQRIGDEFCERHFYSEKDVGFEGESYCLSELGRIFHKQNCPKSRNNDKTYFHKHSYWSGNDFWDDRNLYGLSNIVLRSGPVYPHTINAKIFENTKYRYCAMERIKDEEGFTPISYLNKYDQMPQIVEMMVKTGLHRMALELSPYDFEGDGKPWERLGVSKKQLNRLREINGGRRALTWMRYEEGTGRVVDNETIKFFEAEQVRPDDISFISDRMSERQIMNYIVRQRRVRKIKVEEILRLWADYLSMALRIKMDVCQEIIYKPKDVKQAHDDAVKLCGGADIAKRAGEIIQKFPDVDEIMQSIKEKYEYCDENYAVVVPEKIEDIIHEGRVLGHCLDKGDIYFDRIERRESFIVFLRKAEDVERPYYTMEIEPDGTTRQKRTTGDRQDKDFQEAVSFIRKWQRVVGKRLSKADKELAVQSAELREEEFKELRKNQTKVWHGALAGQLLADVLEADLMVIEEEARCS